MLFNKRVFTADGRAYRRLRSFCLIKYMLVNDPQQRRILANTKDISAGGIQFVSDANIPTGAVLEVDIYLPPLNDFFTAMALVVSSENAREGNKYFVRVRFTAIDPDDRKRINSYIEHFSRDPALKKFLDKKRGKFSRSPKK